MNTPLEGRKISRLNDETPILIEVDVNGELHQATMYNFSGDGMYCVSKYAIDTGTKISFMFEHQPSNSTPKKYIGVVNRCLKLEEGSKKPSYGLGRKIFETQDLTI